MELKVKLVLDEENFIDAVLEIKPQRNNLLFTYKDESGQDIALDKIIDIKYIIIDSTNYLKITFYGIYVDRKIEFHNNEDMSKFWVYIQQNWSISAHDENGLVFIINKQVNGGNSSIIGFVANVVKGITPSNPKETKKRSVDALTYGRVSNVCPDFSHIIISKEELNNLNIHEIRFGQINIPNDILYIVYDKLFRTSPVVNELENYEKIKKQWGLITKEQWEYNNALRDFVFLADQATGLLRNESSVIRQLYFDLSLCLYTYHFSGVVFDSLLGMIIEILIFVYISEDVNGTIKLRDSRLVSLNEAESYIFWPLLLAYRTIISHSLPHNKEVVEFKTTLSDLSHSTFEMLDERNIKNYDFVFMEASLLYCKGRSIRTAASVFASAFSSDNFRGFRQNMSCVALTLLHERLQQIPLDEKDSFSDTFRIESRNLDTNLLLYNTEKLVLSSRHSTK